MPLLTIVLVLVVAGVLLWLVNNYIPISITNSIFRNGIFYLKYYHCDTYTYYNNISCNSFTTHQTTPEKA
ncbi:MAG TPA: hypothetical protein VMV77_13140 [Bacteroidales bacterium]|nr:hypothetical protein [Bacteroidales bacterium]